MRAQGSQTHWEVTAVEEERDLRVKEGLGKSADFWLHSGISAHLAQVPCSRDTLRPSSVSLFLG